MRFSLVIALLFVACDSPVEKPDTPQTTQVTLEAAPGSHIDSATPIEVRLLAEYMAPLGLGDSLTARLKTTAGDIHCDLFWRKTPRAVATFMGLASGKREWVDPETGELVERPFYDGVTFFRTVPDFTIQTGDRTNTGREGPGFTFDDEIRQELRFDRPGMLAFANTGPNTNGSQFFVTLRAAPHLNDRHTIFGECSDLEVVRAIANAPTNASGVPLKPVRVLGIEFSRE